MAFEAVAKFANAFFLMLPLYFKRAVFMATTVAVVFIQGFGMARFATPVAPVLVVHGEPVFKGRRFPFVRAMARAAVAGGLKMLGGKRVTGSAVVIGLKH